MDLLLSSAMNMVIKILYFGRMEGGDWYYTVFKKMFNELSSIKHFNMNLNDNVHQCENFIMDFWLLSFVITWWIWLPKNLFLENGGWTLVLHSCFLMNIFKRFSSILNFFSYLYFNSLTYRCNRLRCPLARFV